MKRLETRPDTPWVEVSGEPMRVLTLWPEWLWAMIVLGKPWENRPRAANWYGLHIGQKFALHGGAYLGGRKGLPATIEGLSGVHMMANRAGVKNLFLDLRGNNPSLSYADGDTFHVLSARRYMAQTIGAVATLKQCKWNGGDGRVELRDALATNSGEGWRVAGQYGFLLEVQPLKVPVPCTVQEYPGIRQGLWTLPGPVDARVREQL